MTVEDIKKAYGDEYPAAVVLNGVRMPQWREGRFSRSYHSAEHKTGTEVSRFMDGSASMTSTQLQQEWPSWSEEVRVEFCGASAWLHKQADFPDMLRFIMQHGSARHWSGIALGVASCLPQHEAFDLLVRALYSTEMGRTANISQAIAHTKHPDAEATLRRHLAALWEHPALWEDADYNNWVHFDTTTCIAHLIETGASPSDFAKQVRSLSEHVCSHNRDSCRNFLAKYYPWLK